MSTERGSVDFIGHDHLFRGQAEGETYDLLLVSLSNVPGILGRDSSLPIENLSIARLAADAERYGLRVAVCDGDLMGLTLDELKSIVLSTPSIVLGLTSYQSNIMPTLGLAASYRASYPSTTICLGGYQVTFHANLIVRNEPDIDVVVSGRGEGILPRIVYAAKSVGKVRGVFAQTQSGELAPLPAPAPERDGPFARAWRVIRDRRVAATVSSDGCISNCSFCATPRFERAAGGPPWRPREPEDVVAEMLLLQSRGDAEEVHFHDPDFLGLTSASWTRAARIAELLRLSGFHGRVRFTAQARAVAQLPAQFWRTWRDAGLDRVFVGLESGNDAVLARERKSSRVEHNLAAMNVLRQTDVSVQAGFIMFTPEATTKEIGENVAFLAHVGQDHYTRCFTNSLQVYPGTADFDRYTSAGLVTFEQPYYPVRVDCSDDVVGAMRDAVRPLATVGFRLDRFFLDTLGLIRPGRRVRTEFGLIELDGGDIWFVERIQGERRAAWRAWFETARSTGRTWIADHAQDLRETEMRLWTAVENVFNERLMAVGED